MKIVCISDTHMQKVKVPACGLLIHAGDLTNTGTEAQVIKALDNLQSYQAQKIILVPGNHDFLFQQEPEKARALCKDRNIEVLIDEGTTFDYLNIWGSPWQPWFHDWAFNAPYGDDGGFLQQKWDMIPRDTNILITHCPPHGVLDLVWHSVGREHIGCRRLREVVRNIDPMLHVFGHVHREYGVTTLPLGEPQDVRAQTLFVNAAICNEQYSAVNAPITINF